MSRPGQHEPTHGNYTGPPISQSEFAVYPERIPEVLSGCVSNRRMFLSDAIGDSQLSQISLEPKTIAIGMLDGDPLFVL